MSIPRRNAVPSTAVLRWLTDLATSIVARSLNVPERLVHVTGALVFAQVQAIETKAARSLCPRRLSRQFRSWLR